MRLGEGSGAQHSRYRNFEQSIRDVALLCLPLTQSDARQLRVGKEAPWHQSTRFHPVAPVQVVPDNPEVIEADVSKIRAPRTISDRPHVVSGGLQAIVDPDMPAFIYLHPGSVDPDVVCVRGPPGGHEQMSPFNYHLLLVTAALHPHSLPRPAGDTLDLRASGKCNLLIRE